MPENKQKNKNRNNGNKNKTKQEPKVVGRSATGLIAPKSQKGRA